MLTGFNTDFKYKGIVYHVQTEDNGINNPVIVTLLYQGGAILASKKTSYSDIIKSEHLETVVKELMEHQHKQIIKDLVAAKFGPVPEGPKQEKKEQSKEEKVKSEAGPFGAGIISAKSLDEVILDYLSSEEDK